MPTVALDPTPVHLMPRRFMVQRLPQVLIFDGLFGGGSPPIALPIGQPLGDPIFDVGGIGCQADPARLTQRPQCLYSGGQLHAIVGGVVSATMEFSLVIAKLQDRSPASWARVAATRSVCIGADLLHQVVSAPSCWDRLTCLGTGTPSCALPRGIEMSRGLSTLMPESRCAATRLRACRR